MGPPPPGPASVPPLAAAQRRLALERTRALGKQVVLAPGRAVVHRVARPARLAAHVAVPLAAVARARTCAAGRRAPGRATARRGSVRARCALGCGRLSARVVFADVPLLPEETEVLEARVAPRAQLLREDDGLDRPRPQHADVDVGRRVVRMLAAVGREDLQLELSLSETARAATA